MSNRPTNFLKAYARLQHKRNSARANEGVSEIIGTVLLIGIGISLFALLMLLVMNITSIFTSSPGPTANIIGLYDVDTQSIIFENRGGEPIPINSTITLSFADIPPIRFTAADYMNPPPGPNDKYWIMGQRVIFSNTSSIPNFEIIEIRALILDTSTNSILLNGVIREGIKQALPYVITGTPTPVTTRSERFSMSYNFQLYSSHAGWGYWYRYSYRKTAETNWTSYNWSVANATHGSNGLVAENLTPGTEYVYRAEICWGTIPSNTTGNYTHGASKQFETGTDYVGIWRFQETALAELPIAKDSTIQHNNGTLIPTIDTIKPLRTISDLSGHKAILFDGVNDYVRVPNSPSLQNFPTEQTIECWIKPQDHSEGKRGVITSNDISQFSQALEQYGFTDPDIISVGPQSYAIVSRGANQHGYIAIINITDTGVIQPKSLLCTIQTFQEFDSAVCWAPKIIHINGTEYAIIYSRGGSYSYAAAGYIKTINILPTGTIGSTIGTYSLAVSYFNQPKILPVNGTVYALFYNSGTPSYQFRATTINIPPVGNPSAIANFSLNDLITNDLEPVQVGIKSSSRVYAIAYRDSDSDGYLTSIELTSNGATLTQVDQALDNETISYSIMFDSDDCWAPSMKPTSYAGYYVIAYVGSVNKFNNYGYVRTFNISSNGVVSNATPDYSADFKIIDGAVSPLNWIVGAPRIIAVDQDTFVIAYQYSTSTSYYGLAQTVNIASNGSITYATHAIAPPGYSGSASEPQRFTYEFYNGCLKPAIIQLPNGADPYYFAVVYARATNTTNQGMVKTFSINSNGTINQPCIGQELLGPYHFWNPYVFWLNADIYAMVYNTEYNNGITIVTTKITPSGDIQDVFLSRATFPSGRINSVSLTNIQGNVYCLMYYNYTTGIVSRSLIIAIDGTIDATGSNTWTYATSYPNTIDIKKISNDGSNDIYAISFHSVGTYLITVHISAAGVVTGPIDTLSITDPTSNIYNVLYDTSFTRVENSIGGATDIYAMTFGWCYRNPSLVWYGIARVITIEIDITNGMITDAPKAIYDYDTYITRATLTRVYSNVYAIAYNDETGAGFLKTIRISDDGQTITLLDPGPTSSALSSQLLPVDATNHIFAVVTDASVRTLRINDKGDISSSISGQFDDHAYTLPSGSKSVRALKISDSQYAFVYAGTYYDAYLQTLNITATETKRTILYKAGSYNISADSSQVYVTITDTAAVAHSVTVPLSHVNDWNYIVCLYKIGTPMKVYVNANDNAHQGQLQTTPDNMTRGIAQSTQDLYFGGYNAIYDDFSIGTKVFSESLMKTVYHIMTM